MADLTLLVIADPTSYYLRLLEELPCTTRIVVGKTPEAFVDAVADADAIVVAAGGNETFRALLPQAQRLRWVHSLSAGVESMMYPEFISHAVPLTNARGVFARSLGEYTLAAMLYFSKNLKRMREQQQAHQWRQFDVEELHGQTLGIVGYGEIGRAAARLAKPFGMKILALKRRPESSDPLVDAVYTPDRLNELMAVSDYVLVAAALTAETRGMVGAGALRCMKKTGVIMNMGRGPLIVEEDLVRALSEGWIRGAALDVFDVEPLPAGHPFYSLDNVLLSPHCADNIDGWMDLTMRFFVENFRRFAAGQPLENIVDKSKGY